MNDPYDGLVYVRRSEPFPQATAEVLATRIGELGPVDQVGSDQDHLIYEISDDEKEA